MSTGAPDQCVVTDIEPHCDPDADTAIEPPADMASPELDDSSNIIPLFGAGAHAVITDLDPQLVITEIDG